MLYNVREEPRSESRHIQVVEKMEGEKYLANCSRFPPELMGEMQINPNITPSFDEVEKSAGPDLLNGGCYVTTTCKPIQKVAVIIPYKDRESHLKTLLYHLHPMLMKQKLHYCIYLAEQFDNGQFNKAMVMNAAFEEVMKIDDYDCIIFHDVDMIPENDKNIYRCGSQPTHLSPAIDKFNYEPGYGTDFGGVTAISPKQYRLANGHSNEYWGWGGEDNDMEFRIRYNGMKIHRASLLRGRYKMILHQHPWRFSKGNMAESLNKTAEVRAKTDGLSDLKYHLVEMERHSTYTKLSIDIRRIAVKEIVLYIDGAKLMTLNVTDASKQCSWVELEGMTLSDHLHLNVDQMKRTSLHEAKKVCEDLGPHLCGGVIKNRGGEMYTLSWNNIPRNDEDFLLNMINGMKRLPMNALGLDLQKKALQKEYKVALDNLLAAMKGTSDVDQPEQVVTNKATAYLLSCPQFPESNYIVSRPLLVEVDNDVEAWLRKDVRSYREHAYKFQIKLEILIEPSRYLYYSDEKYFEAMLNRGENFYTLKWPGEKPPNFRDHRTEREYTFKTDEFSIPNVPGCYAIESRVVDMLKHPYFQWHWWFQVESGNKEIDAKIRQTFWRNQLIEKAAKGP